MPKSPEILSIADRGCNDFPYRLLYEVANTKTVFNRLMKLVDTQKRNLLRQERKAVSLNIMCHAISVFLPKVEQVETQERNLLRQKRKAVSLKTMCHIIG